MQKLQHFSQVSPQTIHVVYLPWVQGPLWQCSGVSDMQIHKYKYKYKDKYTWAQYTLVRVPLTLMGGILN